MKRRDFIAGLSGALASPWPTIAQQSMPVVGFLHSGARPSFTQPLASFLKGLREQGYEDGRNVTVSYRWADDQYDRLPALAADLVQRQVSVIVTPGSTPATLAAKQANTTIPHVFLIGNDPVKLGLVASLNRPGGHITGANLLINALEGKKLELLRELLPAVQVVGVLLNANNPIVDTQTRDVEQAAAALGLQLALLRVDGEKGLEAALAMGAGRRIGALLITADPAMTSWRERLITFADRERIPAIYAVREIPEAGGLASYGTSLGDGYRQVGDYAGRILKGAKPAELPVVQASKFELVFNLKTAKALGLEIPPKLLFTADEVIE